MILTAVSGSIHVVSGYCPYTQYAVECQTLFKVSSTALQSPTFANQYVHSVTAAITVQTITEQLQPKSINACPNTIALCKALQLVLARLAHNDFLSVHSAYLLGQI